MGQVQVQGKPEPDCFGFGSGSEPVPGFDSDVFAESLGDVLCTCTQNGCADPL